MPDDPRANGFNRARHIPTEHEWRLADERAALSVHHIDRIHARRMHADQDLAHAGLGNGESYALKNLGSAEFVLAYGLHCVGHDRWLPEWAAQAACASYSEPKLQSLKLKGEIGRA